MSEQAACPHHKAFLILPGERVWPTFILARQMHRKEQQNIKHTVTVGGFMNIQRYTLTTTFKTEKI